MAEDSRECRIDGAHRGLLAAARQGDFDPANILEEKNEIFEQGLEGSSILHLISRVWCVELEPVFCAVMEASRCNESNTKLYLLKDENRRTILNHVPIQLRQDFLRFFLDKYPFEAIELIKSEPWHLELSLSVWREVDWSLIGQEAHGLLMGDQNQNTFLHYIVQYPVGSGCADDGEMVETIVRKVIEAEPSTVLALNDQQKSVYQCCLETAKKTSSGIGSDSHRSGESDRGKGRKQNRRYISGKTPAKGGSKSAEPISVTLFRVADMLKEQIFRFGDNVDQIRQLTFVEGRGEHEIDIDFSEFGDNENSKALSKFIESLDLQVEGELRNVKLPATKAETVKQFKARENFISKFFADLNAKHNVKKIMCLEVDENAEHPCPYAVFEAALSGVKIDTLDWRSSGIPFEMVAKAVPDVQYLHLYWYPSGYLSDWLQADPLLKLLKLKKITLTILQAAWGNHEADMKSIDKFRRRFENIDAGRQIILELNILRFEGGMEGTWSSIIRGGRPGIKPGFSSINNRESWIQMVEKFCQNVGKNIGSRQLDDMVPRVAIIDDGVDMAKFPSKEQPSVVEGRSFTSTSSWFFSTTGRGTAIARIISSLSPNIHMLIARADNNIESGEESISRALKWCIDGRADIICLGSTLGISPPGEAPEKSVLHGLLGQAINGGIIVFMPTLERSMEDPTMERYFPGDGILKITTSRWIESVELPANPEADFSLMDDIPRKLADGDEGGTLKDAKGNFVSTAIAAGLAASILICVRHDRKKAGGFGGKRMARIFRSLRSSRSCNTVMAANLTKLGSKWQNPEDLAWHFVDVSYDSKYST